MKMADKSTKNKQTKTSGTREPGSTKWLRILLIVFSILLILSLILQMASTG
jgi:hypothetical protein